MANPPYQQGVTTWIRPLARAAGLPLVVLGLAGVVSGFFLPWSRFDAASDHRPPRLAEVAILVLGVALPLAGGVLFGLDKLGRLSRVGCLAGLGAAAFAALQLLLITPSQGIGPGGSLTVLGGMALALGWLLVGGQRRADPEVVPVQRVPAVIAAVGTVVLVGFAGWGAQGWYAQGRFVDSTTASSPMSGPTGAPADLGHQRWQRQLTATGMVGLVGRSLVVRQTAGVRALDPADGSERWHYLRSDLETAGVVASADGTSVVVLYRQGKGLLAMSLAADTGSPRWEKQLDSTSKQPWIAGVTVAAGGYLVTGEVNGVGRLSGINVGDGGRRWSYLAGPSPTSCTLSALAASGDVVAVAQNCSGVETVNGLSSTGSLVWHWQPPYPSGFSSTDPLDVTAVEGGFLVTYGQLPQATGDGVPVALQVPRSAVLLDAATGTAGARQRVNGTLLLATKATAVYFNGDALGISMASGDFQWSTPLSEVAGYHPLVATSVGGTGYLLLRGPTNDGRVNGDGGSLGLVALDLSTGDVKASKVLAADATTCRQGSDGRTLCGSRPATVAVGAGSAFIAEQRDKMLVLTALD